MTFLEFLLQPITDRLTELEKIVATGLEDLTAAVNKLTTEEAQFLTDVANALSGVGSVSESDAEALAATINQRAQDLTNADPANNVPVPTPPVVGS